MNEERLKGFLSGFIGGIFFGTAAIFIRLINLNAFSIVVWRLLLGGLLLVIILKPSISMLEKYTIPSLLLGILLLLHFILFVKSVQDTLVMNSTVLVNTAPIISLMITALLRIERIYPLDIIMVTVAFIGIVIMAWGSIKLEYNIIGDLEALLAALMISIYAIMARKYVKRDFDPYKLAGALYLMAGVLGVLIILPLRMFQIPKNQLDITYLALLAIIPTAGGHTLFLRALKGLAPHETQILALLEPIIASILAVLIFKEIPPLTSIIGSLIIFISIIILSIKTKSDQSNQE